MTLRMRRRTHVPLPSAGQQYAIKNPISEHRTSCCFVIHHKLWWSKPKPHAQLVLSGKKYRWQSFKLIKVYLYKFPNEKSSTIRLLPTFLNRALNYMKYTCLNIRMNFWIKYIQIKSTELFSVSNALLTYIFIVRQPLNCDKM